MSLTYKKAGVDIDASDEFVDLIAPAAKATYRPEVLSGIGPFAACFAADFKKYKEPVLVAGADGVGTKLKLAVELGKYDTIGQDLVAMCVNDIICCGAEPLFFLDYFATGALKPEHHSPIIKGIAGACKACNCSLIGGETAEMPGIYRESDFDLAGFAVGVVDRKSIIDGGHICAGDVIIGIASSGIHSNGYSLVRKIIKDAKIKINQNFLTPTKLYPPLILSLLATDDRRLPAGCLAGPTTDSVRGIAHITGGGLEGNIPRVVPDGLKAVINYDSWPRPEIFNLLQKAGNVPEDEMRRVFNLGIGMALIVKADSADDILKKIFANGEEAYIIGEIKPAEQALRLP